mgnify:CR=1 FL=1
MQEEHQINVHDYYATYINPTTSNENKAKDKSNSIGTIVDNQENKENPMRALEETAELPQHANEYKKWVNACKFQCKVCQWKTNVYKLLVAHIKSLHNMEISSYKKDYRRKSISLKLVRQLKNLGLLSGKPLENSVL